MNASTGTALRLHYSGPGHDTTTVVREDEAMLILSRKVGERIVIGNDITVVVSRVAGDRVTLGLEAPPDVHILRGELRPFDEEEQKAKPTSAVAGRHTQRGDRSFQADRRRSPR
jgi:carbon storage regulator